MSKKSCKNQTKTVLKENDKIISDDLEIADIFSDFFANVARDIGGDFIFDSKEQPSLGRIREQGFQSGKFSFQPTCTDHVSKIIDKLSIKKATGIDKISIKILKLGKESFVPLFKDLINFTINTNTFPDKIKLGQIAPWSNQITDLSVYSLSLLRCMKKFYHSSFLITLKVF